MKIYTSVVLCVTFSMICNRVMTMEQEHACPCDAFLSKETITRIASYSAGLVTHAHTHTSAREYERLKAARELFMLGTLCHVFEPQRVRERATRLLRKDALAIEHEFPIEFRRKYYGSSYKEPYRAVTIHELLREKRAKCQVESCRILYELVDQAEREMQIERQYQHLIREASE